MDLKKRAECYRDFFSIYERAEDFFRRHLWRELLKCSDLKRMSLYDKKIKSHAGVIWEIPRWDDRSKRILIALDFFWEPDQNEDERALRYHKEIVDSYPAHLPHPWVSCHSIYVDMLPDEEYLKPFLD